MRVDGPHQAMGRRSGNGREGHDPIVLLVHIAGNTPNGSALARRVPALEDEDGRDTVVPGLAHHFEQVRLHAAQLRLVLFLRQLASKVDGIEDRRHVAVGDDRRRGRRRLDRWLRRSSHEEDQGRGCGHQSAGPEEHARSAPARVIKLATSLAVIGTRPSSFRSWRA